MKRTAHNFSSLLITLSIAVLAYGAQSSIASASGIVTLTFDDGNSSQYEILVPILKEGGQKGVFFLNSALIRSTNSESKIFNYSSFGSYTYMSWTQVNVLKKNGNEIAGHTSNHIELPTVSLQTMTSEINQDYATFVSHGIRPTDFASPFGAYNNTMLSLVAKRYNSHRAFANQGLNVWPYNKYLIYVRYITNQTSVQQAKAWVDEAMATDSWLVLVFHEILPTVDPTDDYSWSTAQFKKFINYLNSKQIKAKTIREVLADYTNLTTNPSFESGLTGWSTDNASSVTINTATNGSYPAPKNSIQMTGNVKAGHLFSQKIPVSFDTTYGLRVYTDSRLLMTGEVGFYMDEYDQNGAWISGKWFGGFDNQNVIDKSFVYKPTSVAVKTAAIQIYMTAGSTGSVYVDNIELFARTAPTASATPPFSEVPFEGGGDQFVGGNRTP